MHRIETKKIIPRQWVSVLMKLVPSNERLVVKDDVNEYPYIEKRQLKFKQIVQRFMTLVLYVFSFSLMV